MLCVVSINRGFLKDFRLNGPEVPVERAAYLAPFITSRPSADYRTYGPKTTVFFFFFFCFRRPDRPKTNRTDGRACFVLNNYRYDLRVKKRTRTRGPPGPACVIEILIGRRTWKSLRAQPFTLCTPAESIADRLGARRVVVKRRTRDPAGEKFGTRPSVVTGCDGPEDVFALRLTWATEC